MSQAEHSSERGGDPTASPFDTRLLLERCLGDPSLALLVLSKLETQLKLDISEFERLRDLGDTGAIARRAHALKGAAGATAAGLLHARAADVEHLARAGTLEPALEQLTQLRREVERCLASLPAVRSSLAAAGGCREQGT